MRTLCGRNLRPGDRFVVRDEVAVPSRRLVFEVTGWPVPDRGYFSGERCYLVPRRLVGRPGFPVPYAGETSRFYGNERTEVVYRSPR